METCSRLLFTNGKKVVSKYTYDFIQIFTFVKHILEISLMIVGISIISWCSHCWCNDHRSWKCDQFPSLHCIYCTYIYNVRRVWRFQREVIRILKSKKDRQHNGKRKKYKRTNNDLQNLQIKLKDRVTRTPLKTGGELMCSRRVSSSCSTSGTHRVNLVTNLGDKS